MFSKLYKFCLWNISHIKKVNLLLVSLFILTLSGCAHKIDIAPYGDNYIKYNTKSNINVAYYISNDDFNKSAISESGGGDKIKYWAYKDTESILFKVLLNNFNNVYKLTSLYDTDFIEKHHIKYIFTQRLTANSSSNSFVFWPPTKFEFNIECKASDQFNKIIWGTSIWETGYADQDEFLSNPATAAERATARAYSELNNQLHNFIKGSLIK